MVIVLDARSQKSIKSQNKSHSNFFMIEVPGVHDILLAI